MSHSAPSIDAVSGLVDYDAGLLNDWGGGNVEWWQDYLRAEIGRVNEFWRVQAESALEAQARELAEARECAGKFERKWMEAVGFAARLDLENAKLRSRIAALEDAVRVKDEDAERWRALMSSQRMHMMGSFGFDYVFDPPGSKKTADLVDVVPRAGGHMHFGIEFWSEHSAYGDPAWPDDFPRKLLTTYVDEIRARTALSNGEHHDR